MWPVKCMCVLFANDCVMVYGLCCLLCVVVCVLVSVRVKKLLCALFVAFLCDAVWFGFAVLFVCLCAVVV